MPAGPDAGQAGNTFGFEGKVGRSADENFFEAADEVDSTEVFARDELRASRRLALADEGVRRAAGISAEIEDGVADELAGAVEGYVAAAVGFEELDSALGQDFGPRDNICGFGVAA